MSLSLLIFSLHRQSRIHKICLDGKEQIQVHRWDIVPRADFGNYFSQMYSVELEIKDKTEGNTSACYLEKVV